MRAFGACFFLPIGPIVAPMPARPDIANAAPSSLDAAGVDWVALGLVLSIAGSFMLANAILLRHPRDLVREHFGGARRRLSSIRGYVFHRVQVALGFVLLLLGFGLQLAGRYGGSAVGAESTFPVGWVGLLIVGVGLLQLGGWWLSQGLFRIYVREYVEERNADLETDSVLAREVGELFGVEMQPEDTVQGYVGRLRERLSLPDDIAQTARPPRSDADPVRGL